MIKQQSKFTKTKRKEKRSLLHQGVNDLEQHPRKHCSNSGQAGKAYQGAGDVEKGACSQREGAWPGPPACG